MGIVTSWQGTVFRAAPLGHLEQARCSRAYGEAVMWVVPGGLGPRGAAVVLMPRTVPRRDHLTQSDSPAEVKKPREQGRGALGRVSPAWPRSWGAGTLSWDDTGWGLLGLFTS